MNAKQRFKAILELARFNGIEEYDGEALVAPAHEICRPHEDALRWHRKWIFRAA
jgi:hypothetical protein